MSLIKAAFFKPQPSALVAGVALPVLPSHALSKQVLINSNHCERYNKCVNWKLGIASVIHPNYLQVLTLPMQLDMMVNHDFPFKPMGLVHLANQIDVKRLPEQNAKVQLSTSFNGLSWHKKGWVFGVLSEGFVEGELAVSAMSYYLSRHQHSESAQRIFTSGASKGDELLRHVDTASPIPIIDDVQSPFESVCDLNFPLGVGRKYARVSGDYNPIHLTRWTAKIMGFRQAIAHGMYSKALCLSAVVKQEMHDRKTDLASASMQFTTQFMQPIYLPSHCQLVVKHNGDKRDFSLRSARRNKQREHLRSSSLIQA